MNKKMRATDNTLTGLRKWLTAGAVAALTATGVHAADAQSCKTVRMGVMSWTDVQATSGIAQVLLQDMGYSVKQVTASQQILMSGLKDGRSLDIFLGYWQPLMDPVVKPYLDAGSAKMLPEPSLTDARTSLAVPTYTYEKGLKTFDDIAKFKEEVGAKIYGIEPGVESNNKITQMIETDKFGLKDFSLVEAGEMGIMATLKRAVSREEDMVFFGWTPHPMNVNFDISFLSGSDDVFAEDDGKAVVSTITSPAFPEQCPNVYTLLENLKFNAAEVSELMIQIIDRVPPETAARDWLDAHPERRSAWLKGVTHFDGSPLAGSQ